MDVLSLLTENCDFSEPLTEENFEKNIIIPLARIAKLKYTYGATKIVIMFAEIPNKVIKIPFQGYYHNNELILFNIDYCALEQSLYADCIDKYKKYMVPVEYLGKINDISIYAQEKIEMIYDDEEAEDIVSIKDSEWYYYAIELYGQAEVDAFLIYCRSLSIFDLREGNIGYLNEKPVLIDYGGFFDAV